MLRDYQQRSRSRPQRFKTDRAAPDAVHASARKYRVTPETLPDALARASARLEQLGGSGDVEAVRRREAEAHGRLSRPRGKA